MAQPTPYDRQFNFQNQQILTPQDPLPAQEVDAEFNNVKITLDEILANLALIQRDDGLLNNGVVDVESLDETIELGVRVPTNWVEGVEYGVLDSVFEENIWYRCVEPHVSSDTFADDLGDGKWFQLVDFEAIAELLEVTVEADDVDYDNAISGLDAENLQEAIDEIVELIGTNSGDITAALALKANISDVEAADDALQGNIDLKANIASPTFTGIPAAPTAAQGTNTTQVATTAFVRSEVAALIDSSPGALDTLNELAAALGDDPNFATTVNTALANRLRFDGAQSLSGGEKTQGQTNLGVLIGTDVMGYDADLAAVAALTTTSFGRALLELADAAAVRSYIGAGTGDVVGPSGATANAIVRFDGTTGKLVQSSGASIDNDGQLTVPTLILDPPVGGYANTEVKSIQFGGTTGTFRVDMQSGTRTLVMSGGLTVSGDVTLAAGSYRPVTVIASGSFSGASQVISAAIPAGFSRLELEFTGLSFDTASRRPLFQLSTNGGSSYDTTAANYPGFNVTGSTLTANADASIGHGANVTAAQTFSGRLSIVGYDGGGNVDIVGHMVSNGVAYQIKSAYIGSTSAVNAMQCIAQTSANLDGGTFILTGHP